MLKFLFCTYIGIFLQINVVHGTWSLFWSLFMNGARLMEHQLLVNFLMRTISQVIVVLSIWFNSEFESQDRNHVGVCQLTYGQLAYDQKLFEWLIMSYVLTLHRGSHTVDCNYWLIFHMIHVVYYSHFVWITINPAASYHADAFN